MQCAVFSRKFSNEFMLFIMKHININTRNKNDFHGPNANPTIF